MGKRLSKIYTRTGDEGTTGLGDGTRVPKTSPRVEAMGQVDELNSLIGLMMTETLPTEIHQFLTVVSTPCLTWVVNLACPAIRWCRSIGSRQWKICWMN